MGFLDGLLKIGAPIVGNMLGGPVGGMIGGALAGAVGGSGSSQSGTMTTTNQNQMDPRISNIVFGQNGSGGLLSKYQGMLDQPAGMQAYQQAGNDYLSHYGSSDMGAIRDSATKLMQGNQAPGAGQLAWATGSNVQAPAQNSMNLTGSYDSLINGAPGANPYLTGAIQKGINQSNNAFTTMQDNATRNLMQNIMPSIRSNSVLAGQYGGSRQGVAEGNAMGDFARAQQQAASQFGQNNTDAAVAAQAGAYDSDRNRQLAATQGLGAQQYGVAQQNAANANQAEFMNVGNVANWNRDNLNSQLQTNAQNNGAALGGAGLLGGLTSGAVGAANSDLGRAQGVNGLLTPYLSANSSQTQSQPLYQNQAGNMLGGAMFGSQLFGGSGGGGGLFSGLGSLFGPGTIGAGI